MEMEEKGRGSCGLWERLPGAAVLWDPPSPLQQLALTRAQLAKEQSRGIFILI